MGSSKCQHKDVGAAASGEGMVLGAGCGGTFGDPAPAGTTAGGGADGVSLGPVGGPPLRALGRGLRGRGGAPESAPLRL